LSGENKQMIDHAEKSDRIKTFAGCFS